MSRTRAVAPALGAICLLAVTLFTSLGVGATAIAFSPAEPTPQATVDLAAAADGSVTLTHAGGDRLRTDELSVHIAVDGEPVRHQPAIPFVGSRGYVGSPSGVFNSAGDGNWTAGERASLRLATSNAPALSAGSTVTVVLRTERGVVARLSTTAQ
ncbi:type IV pilin [Halosegnis rubeus]|jgi:FlaG/FlaF family flagellin (archaellin)|uniref:Type IV pilin n=1 Tax=Halosegnis rubeus TaxID=2212850 RepID=A0A5N5U7K4_9EURY|nr:type IV pilin N-terminal domain-containing protein [Halosegnis rubeus]KAB7512562.1 type IV pilin [Halosegnis rubeus]KAB7514497.1 type IV pilin [Halosegnis rubeus]